MYWKISGKYFSLMKCEGLFIVLLKILSSRCENASTINFTIHSLRALQRYEIRYFPETVISFLAIMAFWNFFAMDFWSTKIYEYTYEQCNN